jgi:diguanylate cyclase (GGDEF)-like protein
VLGTMLIAGLLGFELSLSGKLEDDKRIEFQEAVVLAGLLILAVLFFGWRRMVEQEREITRRIAAERRSHELAHSDLLTGLANRRQFEDMLKATIGTPPSAQCVHAVLLLDLNGFKMINDVYGHGAGDAVLVIVAQRLSSAMREGDLLARIGGDEFGVIASHLADAEAATGIATRIMKSLEAPIEVGSHQHRLGIGIGVALIPRDGTSAEAILRKADIALYRAKADKHSSARFFEAADSSQTSDCR